MDRPALAQAARAALAANDMGAFTKPAPRQYPHQWNWDSALIALGLVRYDVPRGRQEVRSLLQGQWRNGMVPQIVYHTGPSDYFPDPAFWRVESSPDAPAVMTSGITQPPILATAVRRLHEASADRAESAAFVREVLPRPARLAPLVLRRARPGGQRPGEHHPSLGVGPRQLAALGRRAGAHPDGQRARLPAARHRPRGRGRAPDQRRLRPLHGPGRPLPHAALRPGGHPGRVALRHPGHAVQRGALSGERRPARAGGRDRRSRATRSRAG